MRLLILLGIFNLHAAAGELYRLKAHSDVLGLERYLCHEPKRTTDRIGFEFCSSSKTSITEFDLRGDKLYLKDGEYPLRLDQSYSATNTSREISLILVQAEHDQSN